MGYSWLYLLVLCYTVDILATSYTINIPIREYPHEELHKQPVLDYKTLPKQIIKNTFYQPVVSDLYGVYNGYLSHANELGMLTFPRKTQIAEFTIIVTPYVRPQFYPDTFTIDNWVITNPQEATAFYIETHKDPEKTVRYWKVLKKDLPADNRVPLHAIVLIAKPKNIFIPLGITPTTSLPNLVLPIVYVKRGLDRVNNALFLTNIKQFFTSVGMTSNTTDQASSALISV